MKVKIGISFIKGFSRALDLTGTKTWPELSDGNRADYEAIKGDWENVGKAIKAETIRYRKGGIN